MNNMKKIRTEKNVTIAELSKSTNKSVRYLNMIEKGDRKPSLKTAHSIASALGCSIDSLFFTNS